LNEADSLALSKNKTGDGVVFEKNSKVATVKVKSDLIKEAGPLREIPLSTGKSHIALAPTEADWAHAAVWKIKLPGKLDLSDDPLLRIHYIGDVARLTLA
jgi:hypothetical protein